MEVIVEDIGQQRKSLKIKVMPEDYKAKVVSGLKEKQNKALIPGFRKGHTPLDLVRKYYGNYILQEELQKIVPDFRDNYLKENNIETIGYPIPTKDNYLIGDDWNLDTVFEFDYELALVPEINLEQPFEKIIPHYIIDASETMIDEEVENVIKRNSQYSRPETILGDDFLIGEVVELDENNNVKEGGIKIKTVFVLELLADENVKQKFNGKKVGDEVIFDLIKGVNNESEVSHILNIKKESVKNITTNFKIIIMDITRINKPELNQELFDRWYGVGKINSMEEFREMIKNRILDSYSAHSAQQLTHDIKDYLINFLNPYIPEEYIKRLIKSEIEETKNSPEKVEENIKQYSQQLKWEYIQEAAIKKFEINPTEEEIRTMAIYILKSELEDRNEELTAENFEEYVPPFFKNEKNMEYVIKRVLHYKVFSAFTSFLKVEDMALPKDIFSSKMNYKYSDY
jgi:trigger factor